MAETLELMRRYCLEIMQSGLFGWVLIHAIVVAAAYGFICLLFVLLGPLGRFIDNFHSRRSESIKKEAFSVRRDGPSYWTTAAVVHLDGWLGEQKSERGRVSFLLSALVVMFAALRLAEVWLYRFGREVLQKVQKTPTDEA